MAYAWLDRIIEEQAKAYGLTPAQHARLMGGAADMQERLERADVDRPEQLEPVVDHW